MAKAVVPLDRFVEKFGPVDDDRVHLRLRELAGAFLKESAAERDREREKERKKDEVIPAPGPDRP